MLLLDIEAELSLWEHGRAVWREQHFPVAESAHHLARRLRSPEAGRENFALDSMQAEKGLLRFVNSDEGWRVGSVFTPDFCTSPVTWDVLAAQIKQLDRAVREGVAAMGIEPTFLSEPSQAASIG
ncbi:hypothetical protein [Streptomyces sp. NPDC088736]|uniref:DUF7878 domain-containing protein n=1 Tax=Streptomyces sp. NPDC088736 TaxID=3365881 RepID=UPI003827C52F